MIGGSRPSTSPAGQPNIRSAAGFHSRTLRSVENATIASAALSMTAHAVASTRFCPVACCRPTTSWCHPGTFLARHCINAQRTRQTRPGSPDEQDSTSNAVPLAVASRHRPEAGFCSRAPPPAALIVHCWAPVVLQDSRSTGEPLAVPEPGMSRHLPEKRSVPSGCTVQFCAACPLHDAMTTGLPSAVLAPWSFRHMPGTSDTTGPAGRVHFWLTLPLQEEIHA